MATKRRTAAWYYRGRDVVVHPSGWDKTAVLIFTTTDDMLEWARGVKMVLRQVIRA